MTTRFDAKDQVNYGVQGVKSGYDGLKGDLFIPPCGIEDIDVAFFNLFENEIKISVAGQDSADLKKVPVIFAAGEKWALLKRGKPIRDRNNTLILPLITIMRTEVTQDRAKDIAGRGINQQTGEIVIRRKLSEQDRDYQNIINKLFVENQLNVAVNPNNSPLLNQITTDRKAGELRNTLPVREGALLKSNRKNNIFETLVVPSPQFYTAKYDIMIWAQYTQHMNQIMEKIVSSFLPQAQSWKLTTTKGYWFIATVENGNFASETNFDDMSTSERYLKMKFSVEVPAYIWASNAPGVPIPVKRYVSSPIINFEVNPSNIAPDQTAPEEYQDNFTLGSDDPTLPLDEKANVRDDQRRPGWKPQVVQPINTDGTIDANDPALLSYPRGRNPAAYRKIIIGGQAKYVRIVNTNATTGETVYSASDLEGLRIIHPVL